VYPFEKLLEVASSSKSCYIGCERSGGERGERKSDNYGAHYGIFPYGSTGHRGVAGRFQGEILRLEDPGYEDARKVWNGSIVSQPL
jgi:hypothetical protein